MLYTNDIELSKVDTCKLFENSNYFSKVLIGLGIITSPAGNHSRPQSYNPFGQRGFPLSAQPQECETKAVAIDYKMVNCCACVLSSLPRSRFLDVTQRSPKRGERGSVA